MASQPVLGVCYYPEHWDPAGWKRDADSMAALGLQRVRIGEFAWARVEPEPGQFDWNWLDEAVETLAGAGLEIMMGTPTATPPKWLVDRYPDVLAVDRQGRPRRFGSRRHYCLSSRSYAREAARITGAVAARYGRHPAITHWQTDNELGCHDTVRSYSSEAARAFRLWLQSRYGSIDTLNQAWGTVFWSQTYQSFDAVDLPCLTVTEPNPAHVMDFKRFSSDVLVAFNAMQVEIIRGHAPNAVILHNAMGHFFQFDHFELGKDLDTVGWDSYPLGFLDVGPYPKADKQDYLRQGHPDFAGFHHDLYARCGGGRFQVIEQQPGPVNWAHHNPAPLPGMVALWTLEAVAHGAEAVQYFRWRQVPIAQEQMHAGLERIDGTPAPGGEEAREAAEILKSLGPLPERGRADVALMVTYEGHWLFETQPQGQSWNYERMLLDWYGGLRRKGLDVDVVAPGDDLSGYKLVMVPSLPFVDGEVLERFEQTGAHIVLGPRTFSRTPTGAIPPDLAPGPLQAVLGLKVLHSESLPVDHVEPARWSRDGTLAKAQIWIDHVDAQSAPLVQTESGAGLVYTAGRYAYVATVPDTALLDRMVAGLCDRAGIATLDLPKGLRMRRRGGLVFAMNYGAGPVRLPDGAIGPGEELIVGTAALPPGGVSIWRRTPGV